MNSLADPNGGRASGGSAARRPAPLVALSVMLFAECALLAAASVYLLVELVIAVPVSYASAVAILVLSLIATVWLGVLATQTLRGAPWIRGAATVWQVLQIAVGVGAMQGEYAQPGVGWALVVPAVVVLVLLFTPAVIRATARDRVPPSE